MYECICIYKSIYICIVFAFASMSTLIKTIPSAGINSVLFSVTVYESVCVYALLFFHSPFSIKISIGRLSSLSTNSCCCRLYFKYHLCFRVSFGLMLPTTTIRIRVQAKRKQPTTSQPTIPSTIYQGQQSS